MAVLTESTLRKQLKDVEAKQYQVEKHTVITPSAKEYLAHRGIKLQIVDRLDESPIKVEVKEDVKKEVKGDKFIPKYQCLHGGYTDTKPEYMTQLFGNKLVPKNHRRIVFRGQMDSLQSKILEGQIIADKLGKKGLVGDLEEVLDFVRNILRAEVLEEPLDSFKLIGYEEDQIREMSHHPKKHFGIDHIFPNYKMGEAVVMLNFIRSAAREVEICGFNAFIDEDREIHRKDIMRYLNRLSSTLYVMMLKELSGKYK